MCQIEVGGLKSLGEMEPSASALSLGGRTSVLCGFSRPEGQDSGQGRDLSYGEFHEASVTSSLVGHTAGRPVAREQCNERV